MADLNIMYLTDNNYAVFAGVSILSLFENNREAETITVYVIDNGISKENKAKYMEMAQLFHRDIVFLDLSSGVRKLEELGAPKYRNSYTTYLKLFAFRLLPDTVHRIFFIDSDTVIVGELQEVMQLDMQGCVLGAVKDGLSHSYKMLLGYDYDDSWYNMGIILVDVDAWKRQGCEQKVVEQLKKRNAYFAVDQDLLNITQHGKIMTLHPKYNVTPHHYVYRDRDFRKCLPQGGFYDTKEIEEAQKAPVILHFERFVGESPWHKNSVHPYTRQFEHYLERSLWKDYHKQKAAVGLVFKVEKLLYRILPHSLFLRIWAVSFRRLLKKTNQKFSGNKNIANIS